jgi:hypothetical protein
MLERETNLDPCQDHARIAYDDLAAGAFGVELTRGLLCKSAHTFEVMVVAAERRRRAWIGTLAPPAVFSLRRRCRGGDSPPAR